MIESKMRMVYYSPRRRRHFMTPIAAARAEANARMRRWFPPERVEPEVGDYGWDWHSVPRLVAVHERLVQRYMRHFKANSAKDGAE